VGFGIGDGRGDEFGKLAHPLLGVRRQWLG
jgi:hypothetical protein